MTPSSFKQTDNDNLHKEYNWWDLTWKKIKKHKIISTLAACLTLALLAWGWSSYHAQLQRMQTLRFEKTMVELNSFLERLNQWEANRSELEAQMASLASQLSHRAVERANARLLIAKRNFHQAKKTLAQAPNWDQAQQQLQQKTHNLQADKQRLQQQAENILDLSLRLSFQQTRKIVLLKDQIRDKMRKLWQLPNQQAKLQHITQTIHNSKIQSHDLLNYGILPHCLPTQESPLTLWQPPTSHVSSRWLALQPNPQTLVIIEQPASLKGEELAPPSHANKFTTEDLITSYCFSPDNNWLAIGDKSGNVYLHHLPKQHPSQQLRIPSSVRGVTLSPEGKSLLIESRVQSFVWKRQHQNLQNKWQHQSKKTAASVFLSENTLASLERRNFPQGPGMAYYHLQEKSKSFFLPGPHRVIATNPQQTHIAYSSQEEIIGYLKGQKTPLFRIPLQEESYITSLAFSNDNLLLASLHGNGYIQIWEIASRRKLYRFFVGEKAFAIRFHKHHTQEALRIWHPRKITDFSLASQIEKKFSLTDIPVDDPQNFRTILLKLAKKYQLFSLQGKTGVKFSPDQRFITWVVPPGVFLWDRQTNKMTLLEQTPLKAVQLQAIAFSPDSELLAITMSNTIYLWELPSQKFLLKIEEADPPSFFSKNKLMLYPTDPKEELKVSKIKGWTIQGVPFHGLFRSIHFTSDGKIVTLRHKADGRRLVKIFAADFSPKLGALKDHKKLQDFPDDLHLKWGSDFILHLVSDTVFAVGTSRGELLLVQRLAEVKVLWRQQISDSAIDKIYYHQPSETFWLATQNARLYLYKHLSASEENTYPIEIFPQYQKVALDVSFQKEKIAFVNSEIECFVMDISLTSQTPPN